MMMQDAMYGDSRGALPALADGLAVHAGPASVVLHLEPANSPQVWTHMVLECCRSSAKGVVAENLVGATLQVRFPSLNFPPRASAGCAPAERDADFVLPGVAVSVRVLAGRSVVQACARSLGPDRFSLLLVPRDEEERARFFAEDEHLRGKVMVLSIEDFVTLDVIHLAIEQRATPFDVMKQIIDLYNERLTQVETDHSLLIELR
jgi:hypothetical protein